MVYEHAKGLGQREWLHNFQDMLIQIQMLMVGSICTVWEHNIANRCFLSIRKSYSISFSLSTTIWGTESKNFFNLWKVYTFWKNTNTIFWEKGLLFLVHAEWPTWKFSFLKKNNHFRIQKLPLIKELIRLSLRFVRHDEVTSFPWSATIRIQFTEVEKSL